tara:strand:- start:907 stop:2580 length:1674 start_codon:yes stop_codon:yes gene_type:complete
MKYRLTSSLFLALIFTTMAHSALDRIIDFALLDELGVFHQLSRYQHKDAVVLMSFDQSCQLMPAMLAEYDDIVSEFSSNGIEFLLIDSEGLGRETLASLRLNVPILEDSGQLVSESLGFENSGEVLMLNPERLSVYFRGPVSPDLRTSLSSMESIQDTLELESRGCKIEYPDKVAHELNTPDYATDVAPIIIENCVACHNQGGVGPFALDSYVMVLGWSPMIREVLMNKRMPPMQVDPDIGHSDNARYLTTKQLQTLVHWIDAGAPRGLSATDPLENFELADEDRWVLGEPDYIVLAKSNDVPPTGVLDYIYDRVDLPFMEDKWLRAVEYKAGDSSVLHHLVTFVTAPDEDFWGKERNEIYTERRFVESYSPGKVNAKVFEKGTGVFIPEGSSLSMQFHYVTNGQRTSDSSRLGLYFSEDQDLRERLVQVVSSRFVLPPNEPNFALHADFIFDSRVVLTGVRAKMNYRGKRMKFSIEEADGIIKDIFSIPAYNYGWQPHYEFDEPLVLEAGTKVHVSGALDNSISNPTNPDPDKEVTFGLNSWDEMFTGYFTFNKTR